MCLAALAMIFFTNDRLLAQTPGGVSTSAWYSADNAGGLFSDAGTTPVTNNGSVHQWNASAATGFNLIQSNAASKPIYSTTQLANFNPTVTFDGVNDKMQFAAGTNVIDRANGTIFAAGYVNKLKGSGFIGFHATMDFPGLHLFSNNKLLFFTGGPGYQGVSTEAMKNQSFFTAGSGWQNGASSTAATVSLNGNRIDYSGSELKNVDLNTNYRDIWIGGDSNYGAFNGQLNEMLVFENKLTTAQMDQVETYLAIKYGTTYANGSRDYKNSTGTTVWSAATNSAYNKNIAGIANDAALNQKQSWSTNTGKEVLIATTSLANTNATNGTGLTAGQYLIWGDNGLSKSPSVPFTSVAGLSHRFASVWKVQNTGAVGTVRVAWEKGFTNLTLITSTDATFATGNTPTAMSGTATVNGVEYNYADVILTDGQYFTFAAKISAPGGVTSDIRVWLKSDNGFTPSQWNDQSGNSNNYTQTNTNRQPFTATTSYNFNPAIDFGSNVSADGRFMVVPAGQPYSANGTSSSIFTVNLDRSVAGFADILGFGATTTAANLIQANLPVFTRLGADINIYPYANAISSLPTMIANKLYLSDVSFTVGTAGIKYGQNGTLGSNNQTFNAAAYAKHANGSVLGSQPEVRNGVIGEVIAYERDLTEAEKQRVRTYTAIKYGITLPHDYIASDAAILWSQATNTGYNMNIAGIATDDGSALTQKQSNSINASQQVLIATSGLTNSNALNTHSLNNGQALLWGDNGMAKSLSASFNFPGTPTLNMRFGAIWKVQNTGSVTNTLRVAWPEGVPAIQLIRSSDPIFDDTDQRTDMSVNTTTINGVVYNYADVSLADGSFFTFAGYIAGPGGVASAAWYRADAVGQQFTDAGTTIASDGQNLQQWNEHKGTGFDLLQAGAGNRPVFSNTSTLANFNPTVTFNGSQWMRYTPGTGINVIDRADGSIYAAGYLKSVSNVDFAGFGAGTMDFPGLHTFNVSGAYKPLFYTGGPGYNGLGSNDFSNKNYFTIGGGWENGAGSTASFAGATVSLNGTRVTYAGTNQMNNVNVNAAYRDFQIGQGNYGPLNGQLNEVVVFENRLDEADMDRVETYMSIKYGNTFAEGTRNYVNSTSGIVWSTSVNAGYHYNIAGIARDDQGSLNQKQSWSTNSGTQVLISTTGLENTNATNTVALASGKFLIWGDNNLAKAPSVAITGITGVNYRFASIWKAQNTSTVGTVRVAWPKGLTNLKLIQSGDATIDASDMITDMAGTQTVNGVEYAYADVTINDGQYFTFAAFVQAPGDVTNNLSYWYRADKLVNTTGEGADVETWTDFTSGVVSSQINDVAELPKYKEGDATYFNYNPGVNFTATTQMLGNISVQTLNSLDFEVFTLTKEGMSAGRFFNIGMNNTKFDGFNWDQPGFYGNGNIARRNNAGGAAYIANPGSVSFSTTNPSIMYHAFTDLSMSKGLNGATQGTPYVNPAMGAVTGGHIFGSNANTGTNPPNGDDAGFTGNIGEVVVYGNGTITAAERNKVDSYLAIKYGVTLANTNNYTTSQNAIVWDAAANVAYYNNVAGVGNDFVSALDQKQSRSQHANTNNQVIIGLSDILATNFANTNSLTDGEFLMWGDNGIKVAMTNSASTYTAFAYAGTTDSRRMNRVWKVQNTSALDEMMIRFPVASVGTTNLGPNDRCADYVIIYASDAAFTTNVTVVPLTVNGADYETMHAFRNGMSYFTFGRATPISTGVVYLPMVIETTTATSDNCGIGSVWTYFRKSDDATLKLLATSGVVTTPLTTIITPEGVTYDDGTRISRLMPRISTVIDATSGTYTGVKVRVYFDPAELIATKVPGAQVNGWFKYEGDAEAVITDIYGNGTFDATKTVALTPDAAGVEDGISYVEFRNLTSLSSFVYFSTTETNPLPVSLAYLKAEKEGNSTNLTWLTTSENNNHGFEIHRSADSRNWNTIGFVDNQSRGGISNGNLNYRFSDEAPLQGYNYYRLKQIDLDGKFDYSRIVAVKFTTDNKDLVLYPNPVVGGNIKLDFPQSELFQVKIYNMSGIEIKGVVRQDRDINVKNIAPGMYILKATLENGQVYEKSFIIR